MSIYAVTLIDALNYKVIVHVEAPNADAAEAQFDLTNKVSTIKAEEYHHAD